MNFSYTVRKPTSDVPYIDRDGYGSFEPVQMSQAEAERVARGGGVVQVWVGGEMVREYAVAEPDLGLPQLELVA